MSGAANGDAAPAVIGTNSIRATVEQAMAERRCLGRDMHTSGGIPQHKKRTTRGMMVRLSAVATTCVGAPMPLGQQC